MTPLRRQLERQIAEAEQALWALELEALRSDARVEMSARATGPAALILALKVVHEGRLMARPAPLVLDQLAEVVPVTRWTLCPGSGMEKHCIRACGVAAADDDLPTMLAKWAVGATRAVQARPLA